MDFSAFLKRGTSAAWPHEITVVEDERHALYDPRIENEISDEFIRNIVIVGQIQPVSIRVNDAGEGELVAGRSRWKAATVINHVAGVEPYDGDLACIREAIKRNKGSELEKLINDRCSKGVKLAFALHRGDSSSAAGAMVSENEQRTDDPLEAKIRRVQRLAGQNHSNEDLAVMFGVTPQTIGKWKARDLSKPRSKGKRGKATRPSAKAIGKIADALRAMDHGGAMLLDFATGHATAEQIAEAFPSLAQAFGVNGAHGA